MRAITKHCWIDSIGKRSMPYKSMIDEIGLGERVKRAEKLRAEEIQTTIRSLIFIALEAVAKINILLEYADRFLSSTRYSLSNEVMSMR